MLELDKKNNLLKYRDYKFELQDVKEPNLLEEIFDYDQVPKIPFNNNVIPPDMPEEIWITDTTFRDGQQARPPYTVQQIMNLYDMMHRLGGPKGIIRQSEYFLYSEKDREAVDKCREKGYNYPEITGWIRAVKADFKLVKDMGLKETGILTSCSDYHIFHKLGKSRREAMEGYLDVVKSALEVGIRVRCHLEDLTRADFYGFVVPFVEEIMALSEDSGILIKIRLCDTMGYAVPYAGAALPRSIPELVYGLRKYAGVTPDRLEWHGHNDFHKVLINAATAWLYGCSAANGTLLGFGERTGNPPIEGLCIEYAGLKGSTDGMDLTVITEIAEYFRKEIGVNIPSNYPFVGSEFNTTAAGIHADGVLKDERIYNIFNTAKILNRPPKVNITDKSGLAGITFWVNSYLGLSGSNKVDKNHPGIAAINKWVEEQYAQKRTTSISSEEMLVQAKRHIPDLFK